MFYFKQYEKSIIVDYEGVIFDFKRVFGNTFTKIKQLSLCQSQLEQKRKLLIKRNTFKANQLKI